MEFQKIVNLFDTTFDDKYLPRFVAEKWIEVYDQSEKNYSVSTEVKIKTSMLRSDLCDFSDMHILLWKELILLLIQIMQKESAAFKKNAPFINRISKINGVQTDNAEDLDVVMPMYNLLEYSKD